MIITSERCACGARVLPRKNCERCGAFCEIYPSTQVEPKPFKLQAPLPILAEPAPQQGLVKGRRLRDEAIRNLTNANTDWVEWIKAEAVRLSKLSGDITTDELWESCERNDFYPKEPRAMGAAFRPCNRWRRVGYRPSRRAVCHARPIAVWRLA